MKAIQNEVDSHFRSQLDNRLIEIDNYYKEQIKKAKEAGETEEGDFIQILINKRKAEKEYARKESALSGVDFKEQVDLGNLNNSSGAYFVEETERQKTEILKKYALERISILESMGDEQSRKESELLKIAVEGYNKALSKPSKKSINTLVDEVTREQMYNWLTERGVKSAKNVLVRDVFKRERAPKEDDAAIRLRVLELKVEYDKAMMCDCFDLEACYRFVKYGIEEEYKQFKSE